MKLQQETGSQTNICGNFFKQNGCETRDGKLCPMAQMRVREPNVMIYDYLVQDPFCSVDNQSLTRGKNLTTNPPYQLIRLKK